MLAADPAALGGAKIVYDAEALFTLREVKQCEVRGRRLSPSEVQSRISGEVLLADGVSGIISVSEAEAEHFRRRGLRNVYTLGHATELCPDQRPFDKRHGLLFVGPVHDPTTPNADSVRWLLEEVMPRLNRLSAKPIEIAFAGSWCDDAVAKGTDLTRARVLGKVSDLAEIYGQVRIFVAPTRFAAGLPHKVHEACAHGLPAVVSSLLAQQLGWTDEEELLVADDADAFARLCYRLHEDGELWQRLRDAALAAVARDCSPRTFDRTLGRILEDAFSPLAAVEFLHPPRRIAA